jgi:hypothetical protein
MLSSSVPTYRPRSTTSQDRPAVIIQDQQENLTRLRMQLADKQTEYLALHLVTDLTAQVKLAEDMNQITLKMHRITVALKSDVAARILLRSISSSIPVTPAITTPALPSTPVIHSFPRSTVVLPSRAEIRCLDADRSFPTEIATCLDRY